MPHADPNAGAVRGTEAYQYSGCPPTGCPVYFSLLVQYAGTDGPVELHCRVAGEAEYDGTTEHGTVSGTCDELPVAELTYTKSGTTFTGQLVVSDFGDGFCRVVGFDGRWAPTFAFTAHLAGVATVTTC